MKQATFHLKGENSISSSDFIQSSSNHLAYEIINSWPNKFGVFPYSKTLIIQGPKSSGKTFLANLWAKKTKAFFLKQKYKLTNLNLNNHLAFIIDGLDENWNEEDVLHHFNVIHETNKYLLITLTKVPKIKLPDLSSRINSVNKINILMLDDELMKILIFKEFSNLSVLVSDDVINYLVKTLPRQISAIQLAVKNINKYSLELKKKITIPLIKSFETNHD